MSINQEQAMESLEEKPAQEQQDTGAENRQDEAKPEYNTFEDSPEVKGILDALTVDSGKEEKPEDEPAEKQPEKKEVNAPEHEDNELMESLSERGRERFKSILNEKRQLKEEADSVKQRIGSVQELVLDSGATPEEFGYMLEAIRLMKSPSEADKRYALERIESIRADLAMQLGVAAPGIDPLADFPDLKKSVENFDITEGHALQLAKLQRADQARRAQEAAQHSQFQQTQEYHNQITQFSNTADAYFATRANDTDYTAKMKQIHTYFSDQARIQDFVKTFRPEQWFAQLRFMYDNMAAAQPVQRQQQPIRSRPSAQGNPSMQGMDSAQRIASLMDSMGL